jgi:hypothetical protein
VGSMGAVSMVARAELRQRWRSYVILGLLAGVLGATVLACVTGARRTSTVPERLRESSGAWDAMAVAYGTGSGPGGADAVIDEVLEAPGVAGVQRFAAPVGRALGSLDWFYPFAFAEDGGFYRPPLVDGRWPSPDADDEVVVSQATARQPAYALGSTVPFQMYRPDQYAELDRDTTVLPAGERMDLRVVGVVRQIDDLSSNPTKLVLGGPALFRRLQASGASPGALVRLDRTMPFLDFQLAAYTRADEQGLLGPGVILDVSSPLDDEEAVRPFETMSTGLRVVAVIAGAVGLVVLMQALGRHAAGSATELEVQSALGMSRGGRTLGQLVALLLTATVASLVAMLGAVLLSPLFPLGSLRRLEPDAGLHVDTVVLAAGGAAVAAVVLVVGAAVVARIVSRRAAPPPRPKAVVGSLARAGAGPYQIAGAQFALDPGRGRRAVPVRAALGGAALGVAGVVGAIVVATNLQRLVTSPERYGAPAELALEVSRTEREALITELARDADAQAVGILWSGNVAVGGRQVGAYAIESRSGELAFTTLAGRAPVSDGEVALGPNLLGALGIGIGDTVKLHRPGNEATSSFVVVGKALTPLDQGSDFAGQVVMTTGGMARVGLEESLEGSTAEVAVRLRPGVAVDAVYDRLDRRYPAEVQDEAVSPRPGPIDVLARVGTLAWLLAAIVAVAGSAALVHALAVGVRHRGRDLGVLRALGGTGRGLARALTWMALTVAAVGVVVGVPVGLIGGSFVWRRIASEANVVPDMTIPAPAVVLVVLATFVLAVIAALPSHGRARQLPVVEVLRAE